MKKQKFGVLQAAKYIIKANWFNSNKVDLYFKQLLSPGFFTWVIPINESLAKVGIAGSMDIHLLRNKINSEILSFFDLYLKQAK